MSKDLVFSTAFQQFSKSTVDSVCLAYVDTFINSVKHWQRLGRVQFHNNIVTPGEWLFNFRAL